MKWFTGLFICISAGLASCEITNYECYLSKVFECKWQMSYSGGWCDFEPKIAKCQEDAAEECGTGFADVARKYHDNLYKTCNEDLKKGLEGNCGSEMFTDPGEECFEDYMQEFRKPDSNPFDVVKTERILCKHFEAMMKCQYEKIEAKCKTDFKVFRRVMDPFKELQERVCAIIPSDS